jgi:EAL domain-containing protein (putative c-di-GMP-specific phosphodiesterase class I)
MDGALGEQVGMTAQDQADGVVGVEAAAPSDVDAGADLVAESGAVAVPPAVHDDAAAVPDDAALDLALGLLLDDRDLDVDFRPVVDLRSGEVVGLEAQVRGPQGSALETPEALFAAAARCGRTAELDWFCRAAAFDAVLRADLPPALSLFVGLRPESLVTPCPRDLADAVVKAESRLRVFVEVDDHTLATDPAGVLLAVDRARAMGWGVVVDDARAGRAALAMLPVLGADVVRLDLDALRQADAQDSAAILLSLMRHLELTGATLLVDGVADEADVEWAQALGAVYGQGSYLGPAGPLLEEYAFPRAVVPLVAVPAADVPAATPFELAGDEPTRTVDKHHLSSLLQLLVRVGHDARGWPVVLAGAGRDADSGRGLPAGFPALPDQALLRVVFGTSMPAEPLPGVLGTRLQRDDPLADERFLVVLTESRTLAVLARASIGGWGTLSDVVVTQEPGLVHAIARHLIRRLPAPGEPHDALPPTGLDLGEPKDDAQGSASRVGLSWLRRFGL